MTAQPADDFDDQALYGMINEELLARRVKVMFLKNAGATWKAISAEVGVSESTCRKDYQVVCRDINNESPADVKARHRAVVFDIQRAFYPAMMRGDKDAATQILRALKHEADLLGLFPRVAAEMPGAPEDWANEAAGLIERIVAMDPTTLKELTRARDTNIIDATLVDPPTAGSSQDSPEPVAQPDTQPAVAEPGAGRGGTPAAWQPRVTRRSGQGDAGTSDIGLQLRDGTGLPDDLDGWSNI